MVADTLIDGFKPSDGMHIEVGALDSKHYHEQAEHYSAPWHKTGTAAILSYRGKAKGLLDYLSSAELIERYEALTAMPKQITRRTLARMPQGALLTRGLTIMRKWADN